MSRIGVLVFMHKTLGAIPTRKHKDVRIPGKGAKHEPGWKSAACTKKDHGTCYSNACACSCHKRGML